MKPKTLLDKIALLEAASKLPDLGDWLDQQGILAVPRMVGIEDFNDWIRKPPALHPQTATISTWEFRLCGLFQTSDRKIHKIFESKDMLFMYADPSSLLTMPKNAIFGWQPLEDVLKTLRWAAFEIGLVEIFPDVSGEIYKGVREHFVYQANPAWYQGPR